MGAGVTTSVAFPAAKVRGLVVDELRAAFLRTAERGRARIEPGRLAAEAKARGMVAASSAPVAPPSTRTAKATPAPVAPPQRRAVAMAGMEEQMPRHVQLGQVQPTMRARLMPLVTQRRVATPGVAMTPRIGTTEQWYPTVQKSDEPDWTTYAIGAGAIVGAFGLVWWLKKNKKI